MSVRMLRDATSGKDLPVKSPRQAPTLTDAPRTSLAHLALRTCVAERIAFMIKARHLVVMLVLSLLVLWAKPIQAAEGVGKAYVVLIGIDKFADDQILPRKHGEADAKALYDLFVSKDHL